MASGCSPTSLQQASELAAAAWLVQWSGLVGQVTARAVAPKENPHPRKLLLDNNHKPKIANHKVSSWCKRHRATYTQEPERVLRGTLGRRKCARTAPILEYENLHYKSDNVTHTTEAKSPIKYSQSVVDKDFSLNQPSPESKVTYAPTPTIPTDIQKTIYNTIVNGNVEQCSQFFKTLLPPTLINQILSTAWRIVSQLVTLGGKVESVPEYQVADWTRKAPVMLRVAKMLTRCSFPLDFSGVPEDLLDKTIADINYKLPSECISKLVLPKTKFKSSKSVVPKCHGALFDIIEKSNLISLTMHSELCDNRALGLLSMLSLKELDIGSSSVTEEGILKNFCGLSYQNGSKAMEALRDCKYSCSSTLLSQHLRRLSMSFYNIPSSVYHLILLLFPLLQFYNPRRDIKSSIREFTRLALPLDSEQSCAVPRKLNLLKIVLGCASRSEILEVSRMCPSATDISLDIELNPEETLNALESFERLSDLTLAYYPSFASSVPKITGTVLMPLLSNFKKQIQSLNLRGFNISEPCLHELSQLPELKSISLAECWLANPKTITQDSFCGLENLTLQFLPTNSAMQLLTSGKTLHNLTLAFVASEWEGSAISDTHVKQLVTSGRISTLQSFMAASPCLTLASVKSLTLLPTLRNIGHLARWGLTDEELQCINHSGPPHLICIQ